MSTASLARQRLLPVLGGFLVLVLLGWGVGEAAEIWASSTDRHLLAGVDADRDVALTSLATVMTTLGSGVVLLPMTAVVVLMLLRRRCPGDALFLTMVVLGEFALLYLVKDLVDRSRPPVPHLASTRSGSTPSTTSVSARWLAKAPTVPSPPAARTIGGRPSGLTRISGRRDTWSTGSSTATSKSCARKAPRTRGRSRAARRELGLVTRGVALIP